MYHSTTTLLRDGRVLVSGSNPQYGYEFSGVLYPTELSLETFSPPYLGPEFAGLRPKIVSPGSGITITYAQNIVIEFSVSGLVDPNSIKVTMLPPPFNSHSFSMGQRLLVLTNGGVSTTLFNNPRITATIPQSSNLAPSGYYLIFVVHQGVPSEGIWAKLQ